MGLGVNDLTVEFINKCDEDIRKTLCDNILLCGGNTMFKGFDERMRRDLEKLLPDESIKVFAAEERQFSAWSGGSILSCLNTFESMLSTKREYEECGSGIIFRKCL
ncbi:actin [Acrasis kona]|uniref:Actin n=1 Tax=Acrasis kona TaxID=1008807 RepID=A0AAW2YTP1_9EUKA